MAFYSVSSAVEICCFLCCFFYMTLPHQSLVPRAEKMSMMSQTLYQGISVNHMNTEQNVVKTMYFIIKVSLPSIKFTWIEPYA